MYLSTRHLSFDLQTVQLGREENENVNLSCQICGWQVLDLARAQTKTATRDTTFPVNE